MRITAQASPWVHHSPGQHYGEADLQDWLKGHKVWMVELFLRTFFGVSHFVENTALVTWSVFHHFCEQHCLNVVIYSIID